MTGRDLETNYCGCGHRQERNIRLPAKSRSLTRSLLVSFDYWPSSCTGDGYLNTRSAPCSRDAEKPQQRCFYLGELGKSAIGTKNEKKRTVHFVDLRRLPRSEDMQVVPYFHVTIVSLRSGLIGQLPHIDHGPAQHPGQWSLKERRGALGKRQIIPLPDFFLVFSRGPRIIKRKRYEVWRDVLKTCVLQHLMRIPIEGHWFSRIVRGCLEMLVPLIQRLLRLDDVIRVWLEVHFDLFKTSPRTEMGEDFLVQIGPAGDATAAHLQANQVPRFLTKQPGTLEISRRLELAIGRRIRRLNGRQVDSEDVCVRVSPRHLDGPNARSASQVQYSRSIGPRHGRKVEPCVVEAVFSSH